MNVKYDWVKLKEEFMASGYKEVTKWWCSKGYKITGQYYKMTSGWASEKWRKKMGWGEFKK